MDAVADYAAAVRLLKAPLAAYVSYTEHSYADVGPISKEVTQTVVIRTRDGTVVKGTPSKVQISTGEGVQVNPVSHPPFNPSCYVPSAAQPSTWNDRPAEAIALRDSCHKRDDSEADFQIFYVDAVTHVPLAAIGINTEENVTVTLEERIGSVDGHYLPSRISVHVQGHSGLMGLLNVRAAQEYSDYTFSQNQP
jgi:hypothetical protein